MKKLYRQLVAHLREDFDPVVYGGTLAMLVALTVANYQFDAFASLERDRALSGLPSMALLMGAPWLTVIALKRLRKQVDVSGPHFWRMAVAGIAIAGLVLWFPYHRELLQWVPAGARRWAGLVLWNVKSSVLWFLSIAAFWLWVDRDEVPALYGCTLEGFDPRPYAKLLLLMLPIVAWASFQPSFLEAYPQFVPWPHAPVPGWVSVPVFELAYGFDFVFVELFFRGFLVIGFARLLGVHAVLPMCAMYVVLHFGKPLPEAVGSFFAGYALGVIALRTRTIAGGVLIHLGVAWAMEGAAWMQRLAAD